MHFDSDTDHHDLYDHHELHDDQDNPNHHDCGGRQSIWWVHLDGDLKHHEDHPSGTQFTIKTGPCRALELQFGQQLTTKNLAYSYPQKLAPRGYWDSILACVGITSYGNIAKGTTDPRIEFILPK